MPKKKRYNHMTAAAEMLKMASDESLRIMKIKIDRELEKRISAHESKYFKHPAIGVRR